jgi:hypothetical protein
MSDKYCAWLMDIKDYLEIVELAKANGKKAGDDMTEEFQEILKRKAHKIKLLGITDKGKKGIVKDFKDKGYNILDLTDKEES